MIGRLQFRTGWQCGWRAHPVRRSHFTNVIVALSRRYGGGSGGSGGGSGGGGGRTGTGFRPGRVNRFQLEALWFGGSARVAGIIGTSSTVDGLAGGAGGARVIGAVDANVGRFVRMPEGFRVTVDTIRPAINQSINISINQSINKLIYHQLNQIRLSISFWTFGILSTKSGDGLYLAAGIGGDGLDA